jgi:cell division protein FtsW
MSFQRSDRSRLAEWWFTVDHRLLAMILGLIGCGILLSLAASPAVAMKKQLPPYYFVSRHLAFAALAAVIVVVVSFLSPRGVRRLALGLLIAGIGGMVAVLVVGLELNGARRWLPVFGQTVQPSELMKPGFVVVVAWLFAESRRRPEMPALPIAVALTGVIAMLLVAEPDIGQLMLVMLVFGLLYVLSGQRLVGALAVAGAGTAMLAYAYYNLGYIRTRIDKFIVGAPGEKSQLDSALKAFTNGGLFGRGPGEGTVKTNLPDAHTDFIFAVLAEEYGAIACIALLGLYAAISLRAVARAGDDPDHADRLAVFGLSTAFAAQASINMGVNVGLLPAKGMTLPFVSAGGSSMIAVAFGLGMLLALTRRRTDRVSLKKPRLVATR